MKIGAAYMTCNVENSLVMAWLVNAMEDVEKHDIHIKSKSYKLELLGELVI